MIDFDDWNVLIVNKDLNSFSYGPYSKNLGPHFYEEFCGKNFHNHPLIAKKGTRVKYNDSYFYIFDNFIDTPYGYAFPKDLDGNIIYSCKKTYFPENSRYVIEATWYDLETRYGEFEVLEKAADGRIHTCEQWPRIKKKLYYIDKFTSEQKEVASMDELKKLMHFN